MINLLICEFKKLRRQSIIKYSIGAALIFPSLLSLLAVKTDMSFEKLRMFVFIFNLYLLMPIFLGLILSTLIFEERDNDTLKNILTIPISKKALLLAKIIIAFIVSLIFALVSAIAPIFVGAVFRGSQSFGMLNTLGLSIIIGSFVMIANIPLVIVIIKMKKNYLMAFVLSLFYTVISFIISLQFLSIPMPLSVVFKWSLPYISSGPKSTSTLFYSTSSCVGILLIVAVISYFLAVKIFEDEEG